jgi:hypothetical protein
MSVMGEEELQSRSRGGSHLSEDLLAERARVAHLEGALRAAEQTADAAQSEATYWQARCRRQDTTVTALQAVVASQRAAAAAAVRAVSTARSAADERERGRSAAARAREHTAAVRRAAAAAGAPPRPSPSPLTRALLWRLRGEEAEEAEEAECEQEEEKEEEVAVPRRLTSSLWETVQSLEEETAPDGPRAPPAGDTGRAQAGAPPPPGGSPGEGDPSLGPSLTPPPSIVAGLHPSLIRAPEAEAAKEGCRARR